MMRRLFTVIAVAVVAIAGVVWASAVIGAKSPAPSADMSSAAALDCGPEPIPCDSESSGCFYDCDIAQETPGSGGKCNIKFSVFHKPLGGNNCPCDHAPPDEVVFCYRYHGTLTWCYDTAERGPVEYCPSLDCYGYYYYSDWLELDDNTSYDFYFECEEGCYCGGTVYVDC